MYKNKKYAKILNSIVAGSIFLFAESSMGEEKDAPLILGGATDIKEVRIAVEKAIKDINDVKRKNNEHTVSARLSSELIKNYGSFDDTIVQRCVAKAMCYLAGDMEEVGNYDKALELYEQIEKKYGKMNDISLQYWVAQSIHCRALMYKNTDARDYDKAIAYFERVRKEYGKSTDTDTLCVVAYTTHHEGLTYKWQGNKKKAEECFREVIREFGENESESLKRVVLMSKGELDTNESEKMETASDSDTDINKVRARAEKELSVISNLPRNDLETASKLCLALIKKYEEIEDTTVQKCVLEAMGRLAYIKYQENDYEGAMEIYDRIDKKYRKVKDIDRDFQFWIANSLYWQAGMYHYQFDDCKKALKYFNRIQKDYGKSTDVQILGIVAAAMYNEGLTYQDEGNVKLAEKCFKEVIRKFGKSDDREIKHEVELAQKELAKKKS